MPEFTPGEAKAAIAPIMVKPSGLGCEAEIFLGPNEATKVATSGRIAFTSTGASQGVRLPIAMPSTEGTYHVFIDVYAEGLLVAAYQAIEDVVIAPVVAIAGSIGPGVIWYEGLAGWESVISGREIPLNTEIHLGPWWINKSSINIVGHVDLSVTYPDGAEHALSATINQDKEVAPSNGCTVGFEPFVSSQEGTYTVVATLSSAGQVLDSVTFELVAIAGVAEFAYASDVRRRTEAGILYFEVDIENTGGVPG
ncbi:unnamed protein product, partial [marine sediment metagenome]